jgi:hypothetical protein
MTRTGCHPKRTWRDFRHESAAPHDALHLASHRRFERSANAPATGGSRSSCQHAGTPPGRSRRGNRFSVVARPFSAFGVSPVHLRPDGRGTVRLKSPDPSASIPGMR